MRLSPTVEDGTLRWTANGQSNVMGAAGGASRMNYKWLGLQMSASRKGWPLGPMALPIIRVNKTWTTPGLLPCEPGVHRFRWKKRAFNPLDPILRVSVCSTQFQLRVSFWLPSGIWHKLVTNNCYFVPAIPFFMNCPAANALKSRIKQRFSLHMNQKKRTVTFLYEDISYSLPTYETADSISETDADLMNFT